MVCCALESRAPLFKSDVVVSDAIPDQLHFARFDCLSGESPVSVNLVDVADRLAVPIDFSDQHFCCRFFFLNPVRIPVFGCNPAVHFSVQHFFHFADFLDHIHRIRFVFFEACLLSM